MKRFGYLMLVLTMISGIFAGCGSVDSEDSLVSVGKNGKVQTVDVEVFDKGYYSQEDFQAFAEKAVTGYNMEHEEDSVVLKELTVENNKAKLKMEYKTVEDYSSFNDIALYQGSVADAMVAGYLFDRPFSAVEDGVMKAMSAKKEVFETKGLKVVIIGANTDVRVDGTIRYVTTENVTLIDKHTVSIGAADAELESDVYTYIVYK